VGPPTLEEYFSEDSSIVSTKELEELKLLLEGKDSLWGLMKYLYEEVSQVLVPELLLAGLRAASFYCHLPKSDLN
jgi:hypothetical protein